MNKPTRNTATDFYCTHPVILVLLFLGLTARILIIYDLSYDERFLGIVPDDAFYYFTIARNVVEGNGSSFDGQTKTNGYHPLWLIMLLPVFAQDLGLGLSVLVVMVYGAMLWVAGGYFLFNLASRFFHTSGARLGILVLYLFAPFCIVLSINGLETSCVVLLHLMFLSWLTSSLAERKPLNTVFYLKYGTFCGFIFLARTDAIIFLACVTLAFVFYDGHKSRAKYVRGLFFSTATAGILAIPWLIWNLVSFGEIIQSSGKAIASINHEFAQRVLILDTRGMVRHSMNLVCDSLKNVWIYGGFPEGLKLLYLPLSFAILVGLFIIIYKMGMRQGYIWIVSSTITSQVILLLVHSAILWNPREWYFALAILSFYGIMLAISERFLSSRWVVIFCMIASLVTSYRSLAEWRTSGLYPGQIGIWSSIQDTTNSFPEGMVIGGTDSGFAGYLMRNVHVINLDGVVNSEILEYYRNGKVLQYFKKKGLEWVQMRLPFLHPIFTGPGGLYLFGEKPYGTDQLYRVLTDEQVLKRYSIQDRILLGKLEANPYLGRGWALQTRDEEFRVAVGPSSVLYLPLRIQNTQNLILEVKVLPPHGSLVLDMSVNDMALGKTTILPEWQFVTMILTAELCIDGVNKITLTPSRSLFQDPVDDTGDRLKIPFAARSMRLQHD